MANCLYPAFIGAADACERLDLCKAKDWTCEDCTGLMSRVAAFMKEETTIAQGLGILQGECFCGAAGHTDDCAALVESLAAPAMQVGAECSYCGLTQVLRSSPPCSTRWRPSCARTSSVSASRPTNIPFLVLSQLLYLTKRIGTEGQQWARFQLREGLGTAGML
jgi:hypothetical protein